MMADLEDCSTGTITAATSSDTPLVIQVLHDAQVIWNQAFERQQQEEQKSQLPQVSNNAAADTVEQHDDNDAVASAATRTSQNDTEGLIQSKSPLAVTPTALLHSEAEEWARRRKHFPDTHRDESTADTENSTRTNNQPQVHLLYQDFTALCQNHNHTSA
jgi:hypothetical protein